MSHIIPQYYTVSVNLKQIDYNNDPFKCALFTGDYNEGTLRDCKSYNEISAFEVTSAGNYPIGGLEITSHSVSANDVDNKGDFSMSNIVFSASSGNIENVRYAGIFNVPTKVPMAFLDFTTPRNIIDGTTLSIVFPNSLIFRGYQKI